MGNNRITRQKDRVDSKRKRMKEQNRGIQKYRECHRARRGNKKLRTSSKVNAYYYFFLRSVIPVVMVQ